MVNSKHAFWQALIATILIFGIGLILGFFLESYRADNVQYNLFNAETNILDDQLRNRLVEDFNLDCDIAKESTFNFADKIYSEATKLEQLDQASKLSDSFLALHRRYDLLRALLWTETINLKERCGENFHTLVYLYEYNNDDIDINSQQLFYSRLLLDLKDKYPDEVILIPIATDNDLDSIELILKDYQIDEFPAIIVDESEVVNGIISLNDIENIIFEQQ